MGTDRIDKDLETIGNIIREEAQHNRSMERGWALISARSALRKRKPMEPEQVDRMPRCSGCGEKIYFIPYDHSLTTYCTYCGQAINWQNWKYM